MPTFCQRLLLAASTALGGLTMPPAVSAFASVAYAEGSIRPNRAPQSELDSAVTGFYRQWKNLYLAEGCGVGRAFVRVTADGKPFGGDRGKLTLTVSEAHGYGMLALVMMADVDADAHRLFDAMLRYFHDHPASSDPGLMAWNQQADCSTAGAELGGGNSATDGDLDIAYALLLADRRWGSQGEFAYRAEAQTVMAAIVKHMIDADSHFIRIGDWAKADPGGKHAAASRSSDLMPAYFRAFAAASGDAAWLKLRDRSYRIIDTLLGHDNTATGLVPDFITGLPDNPQPAEAGFLEGAHDGDYSWNAARYPWRLGLDYLLYREPRALAALKPLNGWIRQATGGDPRRIANTYALDGRRPEGFGENQMAFVSMFAVGAMVDPANQDWLNALWDDMLAKDLQWEDYYGNTLKLMAMITLSGHWGRAE